jgi:putative transport protein
VLIAGIRIGQLDIPVSESLKNAFFMLFLFAIGYKTGPQFFHSLRATGILQIALTVVVCATALVLSVVVARAMGFDAGTAGGLLAGAMTESAAFGAAGGTIDRLNVPEAARQAMLTIRNCRSRCRPPSNRETYCRLPARNLMSIGWSTSRDMRSSGATPPI